MVELAGGLAARGLDAVTFNFVYTEEQRGTPDRAPRREACVRAVLERVRTHAPLAGNALVIGGKSMGGRIASMVAAGGDDGAIGLVFVGYPLHPPKQPHKLRIAHLPAIGRPMLFVQGERDAFGTPAELAPILDGLRPRPDVHVIPWGDHSLKVPKKSGRTQAEVHTEVYDTIAAWVQSLLPKRRST